MADLRRGQRAVLVDLRERILEPQTGLEQHPVGAAQGLDCVGMKAATLECSAVEPIQAGVISGGHRVGRNVHGRHGAPTEHGVLTDAGELVNGAQPRDVDPVLHRNVPRKCRPVCHNDMIAHNAVMAHVGVSHEHVVISHGRDAPVLGCAAMDGDELADYVAVPDLQASRLVVVAQVLGWGANDGMGANPVVLAESGGPFQDRVGTDPATVPEHHAGADTGIGPDRHILCMVCIAIDYGSGVDHRHGILMGVTAGHRFVPYRSGHRRAIAEVGRGIFARRSLIHNTLPA